LKQLFAKIAAIRRAPPPLPPPLPSSKPMSGKTWLFGNKDKGIEAGVERFAQQTGESAKEWTRRLSDEAAKDRVLIEPESIEDYIYKDRRAAKPR
jgi:hypothetical protein